MRKKRENQECERKERGKKRVRKEKVGSVKCKSASKGEKTFLIGRKEVKNVLLIRKKSLLLLPTNMLFHVTSYLLDLPTSFQDMLEEYKGIFPKETSQSLPPLRGIEHHINPTIVWVRESKGPCAIPIILVPKKDDAWRMCMDCIPINAITIRYRHLIPQLDGLLDELHGAIIFLEINLRSGYHEIRVRQSDEWKIAFKTKFGLYEWLVMPFGLKNVPSTFMGLMNHCLRSLIGHCVVFYFDDILICSFCVDDHVVHVKQVLELLRKESLYVNLEKCTFFTSEVVFLGFVVGSHGVKVDDEKVKAFQIWPTPQSVSDVRSFHGLEIFYRCLVKNFSTLVSLLNEIIKKNCAHFSEKLKCVHLNYSTYEKKLYALVRHKQGKVNTVADALSSRDVLLAMFETKLLGFECIKELRKGFLFKNKRCVPRSSIGELSVRKAHEGGLVGHFGELKTFETSSKLFY
ncbi:Retrovirus-related Pol polyprotein from transposon 17.6, partial [Mucuna pruriens]